MRKILCMIIFALLSGSTIYSQTVSLSPYGVSPRDVVADSNDIFDLTYNGLLNVGVETKIFLMGNSSVALSGAIWTLTTKPVGSAATVDNITVADTSTEFLIFTPDISGTYVITFESSGVSASVTINSGLYLGDSNSPSCATCHSGVGAEYLSTNHAVATKKQFDAMEGSSSHFGESCLSCHATGYDSNALNNGFDDFTFTFPDSFATGVYDTASFYYPDAMARADVQCEACHGVGSEHNGNMADNKMVASLDSKTCAVCHDSGTHHFEPLQWDNSGHANPPSYPGGGKNYCGGCHDGAQFIQFVNGETITAMDVNTPITCVACHDPHNAENEHQIRTMTATLSNDEVVTEGGSGKLCMNCHQGRRDAESYAPTSTGSHFGPHYVPQADMLSGTNAVTFGFELPTSPHLQDVENSCVGCHMSGAEIVDGAYPTAGGHSFAVIDKDGNHKVDICTDCHGDVGTTFDEKKYYFNANADHDGDGNAEGLTDEVKGLMEELASMLPHADSVAGYDAHDTVTDDFTANERRAAFNYEMVYYDHSYGIHNPAFTVALLKVSIEALKYGSITSGNILYVDDIMNDQGFQVRVVWTAFGSDDGIAKDQVESYTILRQAPVGAANLDKSKFSSFKSITSDLDVGELLEVNGELWDVVANVPAIQYIEYSAVVPTLHNAVEGDTLLTTFKVLGRTANGIQAETDPMSGSSWDNLVPMVPGNVAVVLDDNLSAVLTWDESVDEDFNYFEIYKSETQNFVPSEDNLLKTTIENSLVDSDVEIGKTYYYQITAIDFSKNQSASSIEVNLTPVGVNDLGSVPTEYSLNQNYPNPFNPSTTIQFGLPQTSDVQITIYDMVGNTVEVLVDDNLNAGYHTYNWNASNHASGIYFLQMTTSKFTSVNKMLLVK